jgi:uncharacterized protein YndB with AHSA1/START domain
MIEESGLTWYRVRQSIAGATPEYAEAGCKEIQHELGERSEYLRDPKVWYDNTEKLILTEVEIQGLDLEWAHACAFENVWDFATVTLKFSEALHFETQSVTPFSGRDRLVLYGELKKVSAQTLFDYWTKPELLTQWWPETAEIEPRTGGKYRLEWAKMGWKLYGEYLRFEPYTRGDYCGRLFFTWNWQHEPDLPTRRVEVYFTPNTANNETRLSIVHGNYAATERDQQDRQSHLDGWLYFVGKLEKLLKKAKS